MVKIAVGEEQLSKLL